MSFYLQDLFTLNSFLSNYLGNLTQIMCYIFESFELGTLAEIELFEAPFDHFLSVLISFKPFFLVFEDFKAEKKSQVIKFESAKSIQILRNVLTYTL